VAENAGHTRRLIRPLHPPFTHFPVAAYVLAAAFDVISFGGRRHQWAGQLWHAGTFVLIAGLILCLATMLTGFADLVRFAERRPAVVRIIAAHVCVMAAVFMLGVGDLALRLSAHHQDSTPPSVLVLSLAAAAGVCTGAFFGGTLVYRHGTGVAVEADARPDQPERRGPSARAGSSAPPHAAARQAGRRGPGVL